MIFHDSVKHLLVDIDQVKEWPDNPRSGDITELKNSIQVNGFYTAVAVQRSTGYVIAGNHRRRALVEMGATQIPVVYLDVEDIEATRLALADNRVSDLATYDDKALFALLDSMLESKGGLEGTGYDRHAYELLLQGLDNDMVGGVRQGVLPEERLDEYNDLEIRSIVLPYDTPTYDKVAHSLARLRGVLQVDTNTEVVEMLTDNAMADIDAEG